VPIGNRDVLFGRSRGQRKRAAHNLLSLQTTRTRHVGNDPNVEQYDPDLWTDEFAFLSQPGQADIQSDLFITTARTSMRIEVANMDAREAAAALGDLG